jgi:hypothetical protein
MFTFAARFWTSGTYPCCPKNCDGAISVPGVSASNWYGGYANTTASPVRVGWAMSAVVFGPVRDVPRLGFREGAVDHLPPLGLAVVRPVVRVGSALSVLGP